MAPTIQSGQKDRRESGGRVTKSDFVCRIKYNNGLPDIPFDAKFISYPFEANRFIQYKPTSLEKNYRYDLLTEADLGVTIDLINPDTYSIDPRVELDPADERLLEEELAPQADQKRQRQHAKNVSWLRKTEYISTEFNRFQTCNDMVETKMIRTGCKIWVFPSSRTDFRALYNKARVGYSVKKKLQGVDLYKDRDAQLQAIEGSFEAAKKPITMHHSNPRLKPVEVMPLFPDFQFWTMSCAHVIFDTEPTPRGKVKPATVEEMSNAMIRGMEDESGDQFVAYFLPTDETLRKRKREQMGDDDGDNVTEYKMAREYNWNVKNKASKGYEENYFFMFREGEGFFYNELQTRVRLNKRRVRGGIGGVSSAVSKLIVNAREPTDIEYKAQQSRLLQLENIPQEEEDEEDEEEDEENEIEVTRSEGSDKEEAAEDKEEEDKVPSSQEAEASEKEEGTTQEKEKASDPLQSDSDDDDLFGPSSSEGES